MENEMSTVPNLAASGVLAGTSWIHSQWFKSLCVCVCCAVHYYESIIAIQYACQALLEASKPISAFSIVDELVSGYMLNGLSNEMPFTHIHCDQRRRLKPPLVTSKELTFTKEMVRNFDFSVYNFIGRIPPVPKTPWLINWPALPSAGVILSLPWGLCCVSHSLNQMK